jgi:CxxC motif-containing protein
METEIKAPKNGDIPEIICIVCPNSCKLHVYEDEKGEIQVEGYGCTRGIQYGKDEYLAPKRVLITTVKINDGVLPVIPVRSKEGIPKQKIFEAIELVNKVSITAPVKMGDVVVSDLLGLGIDVITSRSMESSQ